MASINSVVLVGNLTRDPELRTMPSGGEVCSLRIAVNDRRKQGEEWVDAPGYYDVTVFGNQAASVTTYTHKGSKVAVQGRLSWREWEDKDGNKRQSVEVVANAVQFLDPKDSAPEHQESAPAEAEAPAVVPAGEVDPDLGF